MFQKQYTFVRQNAARLGAGTLALASGVAMAEGTDNGTAILTKVNDAMTTGASIATAVVLGLFAIWAIKLLWRAK